MNNPALIGLACVLVVVVALLLTRREKPSTAAPEAPRAEPHAEEGRWDFYLGRVNDAPASISVDLALRDAAARPDAPHRLSVFLDMREPGDHGMGSAEDADRLGALEERLHDLLVARVNARPIGRIRGDGRWQIHFQVPSTEAAMPVVAEELSRVPGLAWTTAVAHDPSWTFYENVLAPDDERLQWILDRRVVEQLKNSGDPLSEPRRVDHWVYFPTADARTRFKQAIADEGFTIEKEHGEATGTNPFALQLHRDDRVELDDIHAVTMMLKNAAGDADGDYDGWETMVLKTTTSVH